MGDLWICYESYNKRLKRLHVSGEYRLDENSRTGAFPSIQIVIRRTQACECIYGSIGGFHTLQSHPEMNFTWRIFLQASMIGVYLA